VGALYPILICPSSLRVCRGLRVQDSTPGSYLNRSQSSLKPVGYTWSYLACRIGHFVPIWKPSIGNRTLISVMIRCRKRGPSQPSIHGCPLSEHPPSRAGHHAQNAILPFQERNPPRYRPRGFAQSSPASSPGGQRHPGATTSAAPGARQPSPCPATILELRK
jgi:hypothetical protein